MLVQYLSVCLSVRYRLHTYRLLLILFTVLHAKHNLLNRGGGFIDLTSSSVIFETIRYTHSHINKNAN